MESSASSITKSYNHDSLIDHEEFYLFEQQGGNHNCRSSKNKDKEKNTLAASNLVQNYGINAYVNLF